MKTLHQKREALLTEALRRGDDSLVEAFVLYTDALQDRVMDETRLRKIMSESVHETLSALGFDTESPREMTMDLIYIRQLRIGSKEFKRWIGRSCVGVAMSGLGYAIWQGIISSLHGGH